MTVLQQSFVFILWSWSMCVTTNPLDNWKECVCSWRTNRWPLFAWGLSQLWMTWLISLYSWWLEEQGEVRQKGTAAAYFRSRAPGHSSSEQRPCISLRAKSSGRCEERQITSRAEENQRKKQQLIFCAKNMTRANMFWIMKSFQSGKKIMSLL